jgi:hypothetical protein
MTRTGLPAKNRFPDHPELRIFPERNRNKKTAVGEAPIPKLLHTRGQLNALQMGTSKSLRSYFPELTTTLEGDVLKSGATREAKVSDYLDSAWNHEFLRNKTSSHVNTTEEICEATVNLYLFNIRISKNPYFDVRAPWKIDAT